MEPDEKNPKITKITHTAKHNNLLIVLLLALFVVIGAIIFVIYVQNFNQRSVMDPMATNESTDNSTTSQSIDPLDKTITTNIDTEVTNLDNSLNSQTSDDLSDTNLSDNDLGL